MRQKAFWTLWALAPLLAVAMHLGPGKTLDARDASARLVTRAASHEGPDGWAEAARLYGDAIEALPEDAIDERRRLTMRHAEARIQSGDLIGGAEQLEALLGELEAEPAPDAELASDVREEVARAAYFTGWLMRLEGAAPDEWKPETQKAQQHYRLLAERSGAAGDEGSSGSMERNLEAAVRLEQMDLSELRALPLPKNCPGCCNNLSQRKREQRLSQCKKPGDKDAREKLQQDSAGAARRSGEGS